MIATDMAEAQLAEAPFRERIEAATPSRRIGAPDDVAKAAAWLISPAARFATGGVLTVSGER
jgi:NAD(P)-dependent dehydrogenase (short-subunit alcohol dehydrogenase family)